MQGAQVQSLVGKRRSHVLCGVAKGGIKGKKRDMKSMVLAQRCKY